MSATLIINDTTHNLRLYNPNHARSMSFDYMDIVKYLKKGCWNVPHISGNILIQKDEIF